MFFVCCAIIFEIFLLHFVPIFFKLKQFCTPFSSKHPCGTKKNALPKKCAFLLLCSNLQRMSMKICHHNSILSLINSLILSLFTFPIQSPALAPLAVYLLLGDLPRTADRIYQPKVFLILYYGHGLVLSIAIHEQRDESLYLSLHKWHLRNHGRLAGADFCILSFVLLISILSIHVYESSLRRCHMTLVHIVALDCHYIPKNRTHRHVLTDNRYGLFCAIIRYFTSFEFRCLR